MKTAALLGNPSRVISSIIIVVPCKAGDGKCKEYKWANIFDLERCVGGGGGGGGGRGGGAGGCSSSLCVLAGSRHSKQNIPSSRGSFSTF